MIDQDEFNALLTKYLDGRASVEEIRMLESFYLSKQLQDKSIRTLSDEKARQVWKGINTTIFNSQKRIVKKSTIWAAACTIAILMISLWTILSNLTYQKSTEQSSIVSTDTVPVDASPGSDKAQLILANGQVIPLDSETAREVGVFNRLEKGGTLVMQADGANQEEQYAYQTLIVPRGGQFKLVLSDGSKIWVNSASRLRFPTSFGKDSRKIFLEEGEAFFEVAKQDIAGRRIPFIVDVKGEQVSVLGTAFNVSTYYRSAIVTSLVEGSVKVNDSRTKKNIILRPGQESILNASGIQVKERNIEQMDAWREGIFSFSGDMKITDVLQQIGRWYDFDIVMPTAPVNKSFEGKISKRLKASHIIELLNYSGIKCELINTDSGKKLVVKL